MAFTQKELEIIKYGKESGKSRQEVESAIANYRAGIVPVKAPASPLRSTLGQKLGERVSNVRTAISEGQKAGQEGFTDVEGFSRGATKMINAGASIPGQALGAVGDVIGAGIEKVGLAEPIAKLAKPVVESKPVQRLTDFYNSLPQETQDLLANITNIASVVPVVKGGQIAKEGIETGVKATGEALESGVRAAVESPLVQGAVDITKAAGEGISRIPSRVATNVAERQAQEAAIKSLSSPKAQTAVRDGIDIVDVETLPKVASSMQSKKLIQTVRDFSKGKTNVDPIEVVGEPIIQRIKSLDVKRKEVGAKLGEASKTIGILTKPELQSGVLARIQSVPGLEGVKLTPSGKLNFKGTKLEANIPSAVADRKAIQNAFDQATKWGDGEKAHLFRQTLFEDLGGKKKGGVQLTGTQEEALEAIRGGLSDVIEGKSAGYKAASNEYRKIVEPMNELRKLMRNIDPSASDDILNMSAGLLARRITSAAASNPQIRQLLQKLDDAAEGGTTKESITQLQDLYNILNKYYDIAPKTGYQSLTKQATSDSLMGTVKETLRDVAGRSDAVRQKALEDYLDELFGLSFNEGAVPKTAPKTPTNPLLEEAKKYKSAEELKPFINENGKITLYHGSSKELSKDKLDYGTFLTANEGEALDYANMRGGAKGKITRVELDPSEVRLNKDTGEFQYVGKSPSLSGKKYSESIYKAYNDVNGSNLTAKEIDNLPLNDVRDTASMGLENGKKDFDDLYNQAKGKK